ncbi:MAG TPA: carbohydrate ABC transporter permease [Anaerolineae bacterium]|nr:carbohydrate ABC transporter permease [Anaerolineae bacterium]
MSPSVRRGLHVAVTLAIVLLFVLPLWWMIVASLRPMGLPPPKTIQWWPANPQWSNYAELFRQVPMGRYALNSLLVVLVAVPMTLLTSSLAGFGLSQLRGPARTWLLIAAIALLMVPAPAVWLFRYQLLRWLGLLTSLWSLVLPAFAAGSPLLVLLFYWTFQRNPAELYEAARVEGADAWTTWRKIAMPMARPTVAAVIVLSFALYWNDFTNPVLYLYRPATYTLPVGLQILKQLDATNWSLLMAGAVVVTLPIVLLFLALQPLFLSDNALAELLEKG